MADSFGNALIFFLSLGGGMMVGLYFLAYAAHCLEVVLQATAAGTDDVQWPDEPIFDWLLPALYVAGVGVILLSVAGIAARALRHSLLPDQDLLRFLLLAGPLFWAAFPVCVLSALSGEERWILLRGRIVGGMLRVFPSTVGFYILSGLVLAGIATCWYQFLYRQYLLLVACIVTGPGILIYARLLGRLGWLITRPDQSDEPEAPAAAPAAPAATDARKPRRRKGHLRAVKVEDPWAYPEPDDRPEPPPGPRPSYLPPPPHQTTGYFLANDDAPFANPVPKRRSRFAPDSPYEVEPYEFGPDPSLTRPTETPPDAPNELQESLPARPDDTPPGSILSERDKRLLEPPPPPYVPPHPLFSGVWTFPLYFNCYGACLRMALWSLLLGVLALSLLRHFGGLGV